MADKLSIISKISLILSLICFIIAIILFIYFKIPSVIRDLSGRKTRKSIKYMAEGNSNKENRKRRKKANNESNKYENMSNNTELLETGVLNNEKYKLVEEETEILNDNITDLLSDRNNRGNIKRKDKLSTKKTGIQIDMIYELILVDTEEYIE